jgi:hypothetical protein
MYDFGKEKIYGSAASNWRGRARKPFRAARLCVDERGRNRQSALVSPAEQDSYHQTYQRSCAALRTEPPTALSVLCRQVVPLDFLITQHRQRDAPHARRRGQALFSTAMLASTSAPPPPSPRTKPRPLSQSFAPSTPVDQSPSLSRSYRQPVGTGSLRRSKMGSQHGRSRSHGDARVAMFAPSSEPGGPAVREVFCDVVVSDLELDASGNCARPAGMRSALESHCGAPEQSLTANDAQVPSPLSWTRSERSSRLVHLSLHEDRRVDLARLVPPLSPTLKRFAGVCTSSGSRRRATFARSPVSFRCQRYLTSVQLPAS